MTPKKSKQFHILKCLMFSLEDKVPAYHGSSLGSNPDISLKNIQNVRHKQWSGQHTLEFNCLFSAADPWHFGVDPDPDSRIHASD
jgi:kynureninase